MILFHHCYSKLGLWALCPATPAFPEIWEAHASKRLWLSLDLEHAQSERVRERKSRQELKVNNKKTPCPCHSGTKTDKKIHETLSGAVMLLSLIAPSHPVAF
ncbi:hypothetical protein GQ53DRAFT_69622 [Thozetella sp. PMI_491]|nr:hypothetical protein GQ53DRAFT_69622 [Thozetella sp. PMI_491]